MSNWKKEVTLPRHVLDDAAIGAEIMCRLYAPPQTYELAEYLNRFLEKYGVYQEVPINELFDEDWGLGIPEMYRTNIEKSSMEDVGAFKRNAILFQWVANAISNHEIELILTDEQVEELTVFDNFEASPETMEIYYSIYANSLKRLILAIMRCYLEQVLVPIERVKLLVVFWICLMRNLSKNSLKYMIITDVSIQKHCCQRWFLCLNREKYQIYH